MNASLLIKRILFSNLIFYVFISFVVIQCVDFKKIEKGLNIRALKYNLPNNFDYLFSLENVEVKASRKKLGVYVHYFEKITEYMSKRPDGFGLLAYTYYHLGQIDKSIETYQNALDLYEESFSFNYNIGLLYYKKGNFQKAAFHFRRALKTDPKKNLAILMSEKNIYQLVIKNAPSFDDDLVTRLANQYQMCYGLLALNLKYMGEERLSQETFAKLKRLNPSLKTIDLRPEALTLSVL